MNYGRLALEHEAIERLYHVLKGIEKETNSTSDEVGVHFYDTGIITISVKGKDVEFFFGPEDLENWIMEKSDENTDNSDNAQEKPR